MSEDGFIKNINATPGNSYDGDILIPLIDEMIEHGFNASEVVGDTAYGEVDNRNRLLLKGITVIAPFKKETNRGFFPQSKFTIEEHGVTCPAGCRTMVWNHNKKTETITFYFNKNDCGNCKLKEKCTVCTFRTLALLCHYAILKSHFVDIRSIKCPIVKHYYPILAGVRNVHCPEKKDDYHQSTL